MKRSKPTIKTERRRARNMSLPELSEKFLNEVVRGEVIDASGDGGPNPVVELYQPGPKLIVEDVRAATVDEGDEIQAQVTTVHKNVLFGELVDEEPQQDTDPDYRVCVFVVGHKLKSQRYREEIVAETIADFVREKGLDAEVRRQK